LRERPLRAVRAVADVPSPQRALIWALGLGAFGLAFSITTTAAYLPPLLQEFTRSSSVIAVVLGAEGLFAICLPLVIGPWSDHFHTPLGRRRPFMLVAIPPMAFCLALVAFMPNVWTTALLVFAFFFAYYLYEPPYRGLYPDLVPHWMYGRAQSVQHALRGVALGGALVGGGFLFHAWEPSPFVVAALVTILACGGAVALVREDGGHGRVFKGVRNYLATSWSIVRGEPELRRFLIANTAWEGSFAAARTFVVLYVVIGLGQPTTVSATVLATVAAGYAVAAVVSGFFADRFGFARVIAIVSILYGGGYVAAGAAQTWHDWYYAAIFPVAIAGGTVMTLSWGLLFKLMPPQHRGAIAGVATTTKGIGLLAGPITAGVAIDVLAPHLEATDGYQVLWPICGIPILAAIPLVRSLARDEPVGRPPPEVAVP
jgi:MFS family permease